MTRLVQAALVLRKSARRSYGFATAGVLAGLDLLGIFRVRVRDLGLEHAVVGVAWLSVFLARLLVRQRAGAKPGARPLHDLELGLLLLVALHAVIQMNGGLGSVVYPVMYVFVAFAGAFAARRIAWSLLAFSVAFEAALYFVTEQRQDPELLGLHAGFLTAFASLNILFTHAEISRVRSLSARRLDEERKRVQDDARLFRLVGAPTEHTSHDEEKLFRSSVDQVKESLVYTLELLKRSLALHSCVVLLRDAEREQLRIMELASDSDDIAEGPFGLGEGAVGAAAKRGLTMNLEHLRPGYRGICYYRGPASVRAFVAVPIQDGGEILGALCADRLEDRAFNAQEEETLKAAVRQVLRALENERVFTQLERSKREQTILYRASQALGAALDEEAVLDAGLAAAGQIAAYDFAAVTQYDASTRTHSVKRAVGEGATALERLTFRDNHSLTAMAIKNRHYLPYRGAFDSGQQVVYTQKTNLPGMQSLMILPLLVRETAIGTLALAARRRDAFGDTQRPALQALANQLSIALSNAASVRRLEALATTDELTGCLNKRIFHEELDRKLKAAERFGRKLSLVITDLDHFKAVNDTYGHATGDAVLRELGAVLMRLKRETDIVARFGGEEFCVLCEETDSEGAILLAERVREEIDETVFQTELGRLRVTCSAGVATYPDDASDKRALFESADRALYSAKHAGRNQVCRVAA